MPQCDDSAFGTSYVLEDAALWRELPMPPSELPALPWSPIPLARSPLAGAVLAAHAPAITRALAGVGTSAAGPSASAAGPGAGAWGGGGGGLGVVAVAVDTAAVEAALEAQLRQAVATHRRAVLGPGAGPLRWDEGLSHLLMPALAAYEHVSGGS